MRKKYRVKLVERVTYMVDVEAKNAAEAGELAQFAWTHSAHPDKDFGASGDGTTVVAAYEDPPNWDPF